MKTENWAIVASVLAGLGLVGFFAAPSLLAGSTLPGRSSR